MKINNLAAKKIVIIGGDRREVELYRIWHSSGLNVKMIGFEQSPLINEQNYAVSEDLDSAEVLVLPLSGIKAEGTVVAEFAAQKPLKVTDYLERPVGSYLLLVGSVAPEWKKPLPVRACPVFTADNHELALLNAVPTAEGAIQKAMELSEITLHNSSALVIGLGRTGTVLARMLQGIGAQVTAAVNNKRTAALAYTMNIKSVPGTEIREIISEMDFIFNTAPAMILNELLVKRVKKSAIIIDLASAPGGTDFGAAESEKITALLLPGLPGKVAPLTAARILSAVYRDIIMQMLVN